jgi:hypothetical protein
MSTVKVNTVDKRTGSTLTLGGCGTTVTLGAGATQSGFGRTGTVDWCTTAKTSPFTGVSGNGYFVNTTSGVVTVTLPATPSAGDIISIADYASTFQTNNLTICRNSSKINGVCGNATLSTEGQSITLVYVDGTRGWKNTMDSTSDVSGAPNYIIATGGTITCCGDYKIHTFTSDGYFAVTNAGTPAGSDSVDYLVVAGGGGGGFADIAGAGGAGGFRLSNSTCMPAPLTSPLANPTGLPVSVQSYPITVGAGGGPTTAPGVDNTPIPGYDSIFSTITSAGGGGGGAETANPVISYNGRPGGSGGGGSYSGASTSAGGAGNTPPTSPPQGNPGGTNGPAISTSPLFGQGGGGGAGAAGSNGTSTTAGNGGIGSYVLATGFAGANGTTGPVCGARYFAGGGGSSVESGSGGTPGSGGAGGGGSGGRTNPTIPAVSGTTNTGGGGGAGENGTSALASGSGGSGIVIIRYKYQ